ncbi:MAG: HPr family phosphocarrier protein [Pirellulales bacterium]
MVRRKVVVTNEQGLHARPADMFVKTARRFASVVMVCKNHERVDGKSILSMLTLAAVEGTELWIEATGPDAEATVEALSELFAKNFSEDAPPSSTV